MRISKSGQITIPEHLRERYGLRRDVEIEITPTAEGLLIKKRSNVKHPVERVYGILGGGDTDQYIEHIRGR